MIDIDNIIAKAEKCIENGNPFTVKTKYITLVLEPTDDETLLVEIDSIKKKVESNKDFIDYLDDLNDAEIEITDLEEIMLDIETYEQDL